MIATSWASAAFAAFAGFFFGVLAGGIGARLVSDAPAVAAVARLAFSAPSFLAYTLAGAVAIATTSDALTAWIVGAGYLLLVAAMGAVAASAVKALLPAPDEAAPAVPARHIRPARP